MSINTVLSSYQICCLSLALPFVLALLFVGQMHEHMLYTAIAMQQARMQNSCDVLITNASAVIPKVGIVDTNIMIEGEKIKALTNSAGNIAASRKIDARGKYVLPGL